ncbi:MAG: hypothetical protein JWL63_83 [Rhodocyclales bacterium]|nr:hypothetical protein [Rhodocyclales bacterium]
MAAPARAEWLASLSPPQSFALIIALSLVPAIVLAWLTQFRRRYAGPSWLLWAFAGCGLLVAGLLSASALALPYIPTYGAGIDTFTAVARLVLFALFCMVTLQSRPVSESVEDAL